jgi:hypothetical protein
LNLRRPCNRKEGKDINKQIVKKPTRKIRRTILLPVIFVIYAAAAQTQTKTVTEFYLALPGSINGIEGTQDSDIPGFENDFFFYTNERNESTAAIRAYRKSLIKIEDITNGYLRLEAHEWKGWAEIALFKKADGSYVVAISQVACTASCRGGVIFATYRSGHWKDVTKQLLPHSSQQHGYYQLPRVGTSIVLVCGDKTSKSCLFGVELAEFQWNKERFVAPH